MHIICKYVECINWRQLEVEFKHNPRTWCLLRKKIVFAGLKKANNPQLLICTRKSGDFSSLESHISTEWWNLSKCPQYQNMELWACIHMPKLVMHAYHICFWYNTHKTALPISGISLYFFCVDTQTVTQKIQHKNWSLNLPKIITGNSRF